MIGFLGFCASNCTLQAVSLSLLLRKQVVVWLSYQVGGRRWVRSSRQPWSTLKTKKQGGFWRYWNLWHYKATKGRNLLGNLVQAGYSWSKTGNTQQSIIQDSEHHFVQYLQSLQTFKHLDKAFPSLCLQVQLMSQSHAAIRQKFQKCF